MLLLRNLCRRITPALVVFGFLVVACAGGSNSSLPSSQGAPGNRHPMTSGAQLDADIISMAPTAYYKMNETSGSSIVDSSGNGYNLTNTTAGISFGQAGLVPDGGSSNGFVATAAAYGAPKSIWGLDNSTIVAVVSGTFSGGWHTVACFPYYNCLSVANGKLAKITTAGAQLSSYAAGPTLADGTTHLLVLEQSSNGHCYGSVDGSTLTYFSGSCGYAHSTPYWQIGRDVYSGKNYPGLPGSYDDVLFWDGKMLSQAQICQIAMDANLNANPACPPDVAPAAPPSSFVRDALSYAPLAFYPLNETSGTTAYDLSGHNYHGTYYNSPTLASPSLDSEEPNTSVGFDGTSQWLSLPLLPINVSANGTAGQPMTLVGLFDPTTTNTGTLLNYRGFGISYQSGAVSFWSQFVGAYKGGEVSVSMDKPHFVAVTCNCVAPTSAGYDVELYVDGHVAKYDNTGASGNNAIYDNSSIATSALQSAFFAGDLQYVGIYDNILSASQICQLAFDAGFTSGGCTGPTPPATPTPRPSPLFVSSTSGGDDTLYTFDANASGNVAPLSSLSGIPGGPFSGVAVYNGIEYFETQTAIFGVPLGSSGGFAPTVTISGDATLLNPAGSSNHTLITRVDGAGNIYAGISISSSVYDGGVGKFLSGANGNAAPVQVLSSSDFYTPISAFDVTTNGKLWVSIPSAGAGQPGYVAEYPSNFSDTTSPIAVIQGSSTGIQSPYGVRVDSAGRIYVVNSNGGAGTQILVFPPGASGNVAPIEALPGTSPGYTFAVDADGGVYVDDSTNLAIYYYAPGQTGTVTTPTRTITSSGTIVDGYLGL